MASVSARWFAVSVSAPVDTWKTIGFAPFCCGGKRSSRRSLASWLPVPGSARSLLVWAPNVATATPTPVPTRTQIAMTTRPCRAHQAPSARSSPDTAPSFNPRACPGWRAGGVLQMRYVEGGVDDLARLLLHPGQVLGAAERLGVDLVDVLGARGPGGDPRGPGRHLQAADLRPVAGRLGEPGGDLLARQLRGGHRVRGQCGEGGLLLPGGRRVDAGVRRLAVAGDEVGVPRRRRRSGHRQDLRGQQREDDAVLVGRPRRAVAAQEG